MLKKSILVLFLVKMVLNVSCEKSSEGFNLKDAPEACQNLKPIESNYIPEGETIQIEDFDVYETKNKTSKRMLIAVYDIFGFHPNTQQVADKLSLGGFRIAMPDFFRGSPWNISNFPPPDRSELTNFLTKNGTWQVLKNDVVNTIKHYRNEGVEQFGIFGFCWGGKIALDAASEFEDIQVAGLVHPSFVKTENADQVKAPMFLCPSKNEPDMIPFFKILQNKFGENAGHRRFDDMIHGFAGARGDFENELNRKRVNEVIFLLTAFFDKQFIRLA